jgi:hypothetical protein
MMKAGVPVGAGTDATRVSSFNPWVSLYWLVTGRTVGGTALYPEANRLDRAEALRRYTLGSAWFSGEDDKKGAVAVGKLADLAVLSADYFAVPEDEIKRIESVLTVVGGKVVYAAGDFAKHAPALPPVSPDWSPVKAYGGYHRVAAAAASPPRMHGHAHPAHDRLHRFAAGGGAVGRDVWGSGCECFVV